MTKMVYRITYNVYH